jgi:hypothetical protein
VDRALRVLMSRAMKRGRAGEPVWLAVAAAAWLVRRGLKSRGEVAWSGRVEPGQHLEIAVVDSTTAAASTTGGE